MIAMNELHEGKLMYIIKVRPFLLTILFFSWKMRSLPKFVFTVLFAGSFLQTVYTGKCSGGDELAPNCPAFTSSQMS